MFFFFKQKTAYEMRISDWSSDVCSSDLQDDEPQHGRAGMAKLPEIEAEAAVEQDDGDGELDDRLLQGAEIAFRIDDAEHRPGDEAGQAPQRDCRPAGAPRDTLRADAEDAAQPDLHTNRTGQHHHPPNPR